MLRSIMTIPSLIARGYEGDALIPSLSARGYESMGVM
jgi:hypothetical protein